MRTNKLIKTYRAKRGLTQAKLAKSSGFHTQYISAIEAERVSLGPVTVKRLNKNLNIPWVKLKSAMVFDYVAKIQKII